METCFCSFLIKYVKFCSTCSAAHAHEVDVSAPMNGFQQQFRHLMQIQIIFIPTSLSFIHPLHFILKTSVKFNIQNDFFLRINSTVIGYRYMLQHPFQCFACTQVLHAIMHCTYILAIAQKGCYNGSYPCARCPKQPTRSYYWRLSLSLEKLDNRTNFCPRALYLLPYPHNGLENAPSTSKESPSIIGIIAIMTCLVPFNFYACIHMHALFRTT